ncbi:TOBE domain-containing protein [Actinoallomurus iriomotensis]|uniref:MerR family transcriptional regulator n=1 Tax=Actinoallomurus iriomotensis TaxID=478107 RepID=A0A9W6SA38_9ACTN|nr:helix-turn-helix transcriptional regulator [Actinoallomurus iriomotensis]GLY72473.1 MerR family transcriptional regulator [Actinoallomurus iriomotensis]GLY90139.1 MerR family transcriptional regulator [Actinoallomurus iriomotensis]
MTVFRISEVASLLDVSPDTVRRWVDSGRLAAERDEHGHRIVSGADLAAFVRSPAEAETSFSSARNRMRGIVTDVVRDGVMAKVEIQAGPYRVVSLMSREAADDLGLEPGVVAVAVVKSTNVVVERTE